MAASTSKGFKYWQDGLPVNVLNATGRAGTMKFWENGLPAPYLEPAGDAPAVGPSKSSLLLLGVGK